MRVLLWEWSKGGNEAGKVRPEASALPTLPELRWDGCWSVIRTCHPALTKLRPFATASVGLTCIATTASPSWVAARYVAIAATIGSTPEGATAAIGAEAPAVAETVASAMAVPPAATLAAWDRKRRRDGAATGWV